MSSDPNQTTDMRQYLSAEAAAKKLGVRPSFVYAFLLRKGVPDECDCRCIVTGRARQWFRKEMIAALERGETVDHAKEAEAAGLRFGRWRVNRDNWTAEHDIATPRFGWYVDLERIRSVDQRDEYHRSILGKTWSSPDDLEHFRTLINWWWGHLHQKAAAAEKLRRGAASTT